MFTIYDHMAAALVASVVILMLLTVRHRAAEAGLEQTSMYVAKKHLLDFAEWVEDDLIQMGSHFDSTDTRFTVPTKQDGNTVFFEFYSDSVNYAVSPPDTVHIQTRYELAESDTVVLADSTVQLYQLKRTVRKNPGTGWSGWASDGFSPPNLSYFEISLFDDNGQAVASETKTEYIRVAFSLVPSFQTNRQYINQLSWGTTLHAGTD
jgi:hypothetical protein